MARKRLLVDVDVNQWAALKGQAEVEGRFVRVLLAEALGMYLARKASAGVPMFQEAPALKPSVDDLRALVRTVEPGETVTVGPFPGPVDRPESPREKAQRMAERQAYLRDHPEDEQQ